MVAVKIRKVGNSYTLTVPAHAVDALQLHDGQEMKVEMSRQALTYRIFQPVSSTISWDEFASSGANIRDGMSPDDYVRSLRDGDREEVLL